MDNPKVATPKERQRPATAPTWKTHPRRQGHRLRNLPFADFANDAWLTLVMIAQTLVC